MNETQQIEAPVRKAVVKLFVVPTPIGNLGDITLRAINVLKHVDLVIAEDTRTSGFLLKHFGIEKKLLSYHKFNEHATVDKITSKLKEGNSIALISDAGTPGISDPGFLLIRACVAAGIEVECLPGPTALIPALILSGFPTDRFVFEGFLPPKKGRQTRLKQIADEERTVVVYESPYRIAKTIDQLAEFCEPDRRACISRELTKLHEEVIRGTLQELAQVCCERDLKGEMVVVIEGKK